MVKRLELFKKEILKTKLLNTLHENRFVELECS